MSHKRAARNLPRRSVPRHFRRAFLYRGVFARVARELDISISHVRRVALGERASAEVEAALTREIERIEEAA